MALVGAAIKAFIRPSSLEEAVSSLYNKRILKMYLMPLSNNYYSNVLCTMLVHYVAATHFMANIML